MQEDTNTYHIHPDIKPRADFDKQQTIKYIDYSKSVGYPAKQVTLPDSKDFTLVEGEGIRFEQFDNALKINTSGVSSVNVIGENSSGIYFVNNGTSTKPNFQAGVNPKDLAVHASLIQSIIFNGVEYEPVQGVVNISASANAPIQRLVSDNNSVDIISTAKGTYNLQTKPVKVNGQSVPVASDGTALSLVNGNNTQVERDNNNNSVKVNVTGVVKTINNVNPDSNGNVNINLSNDTLYFQAVKTLTNSDVTALTGTGFNILTAGVTNGVTPPTISSTDIIMLYLNDNFIPLTQYVRTGAAITLNGITPSTGDAFSWIVMKNP